MVRLGALLPLHRFVGRYFEHERVREAFSFHSLFIGGDPYRVPAIYGALVYLQLLDGGWYTDGGIYSLVEAMARALTSAATRRSSGSSSGAARDRRRAARAASGSRPTSWSPTPTSCARTRCSAAPRPGGACGPR